MRFTLLLTTALALPLFAAGDAHAYSNQAQCEEYEGAGQCAECHGGWHRFTACESAPFLDDSGNDGRDLATATDWSHALSLEHDAVAQTAEEASAGVTAAIAQGLDPAEAQALASSTMTESSHTRAALSAATAAAQRIAQTRRGSDRPIGDDTVDGDDAGGCSTSRSGGAALIAIVLGLAVRVPRRRGPHPRT